MAPGTQAPTDQRVNAFQVGDAYLFRHYFDGDAVFARLRRYYEPEQYRFRVPVSEFADVRQFLADHDYALQAVTDLDAYGVVVRKYTTHPDNIFKESVLQRDRGEYTLFVLRDERAVSRAVADGATRLENSPLSLALDTQARLPTAEG